MRNPAQFLEKSLEECGVSVDSVTHEYDRQRMAEHFTVSKRLGGELYRQNVSITAETMEDQEPEKVLAMQAQEITRLLKNEMTEEIFIGDRAMMVCPYDGGWAACEICGAEAKLADGLKPRRRFESEAELSCPQPRPQSPEQLTQELSDENEAAVKLYLLGLLREECEPDCPNSRHTERFK